MPLFINQSLEDIIRLLTWLCQKDIISETKKELEQIECPVGNIFTEVTMAVSGFQMLWKVGSPKYSLCRCARNQLASQHCVSDNASLLL